MCVRGGPARLSSYGIAETTLSARSLQESERFLKTVKVLPVRRAGVAPSADDGSDELVSRRVACLTPSVVSVMSRLGGAESCARVRPRSAPAADIKPLPQIYSFSWANFIH